MGEKTDVTTPADYRIIEASTVVLLQELNVPLWKGLWGVAGVTAQAGAGEH